MRHHETANRRSNNRANLKNAVIPSDGVRKCIARYQRGKKRTPGRPRKRPRRAADKKEEINDRNRGVVEMESTLMSLEHIRDRTQSVIACAQDRHLWDGEMLPGNQRQQRRYDRTKNLRDQDDVFAADPVGQMARRQRQANDRNCEDESHQAERRR